MQVKLIENKKNVLELEFDEKTLPIALCAELQAKGVDVISYEGHPLLGGFKIRVEDKEPMKKLKSAITQIDKDWADFRKQLEKNIPKK